MTAGGQQLNLGSVVPESADDERPLWAEVRVGDCRRLLADLTDNSVHLVVADPPYFLEGLDGEWEKGAEDAEISAAGSHLPIRMKFDPRQGVRLQEFLAPVCRELHRVAVPGAFVLMFAQPRLIHRTGVALEDAGFEIRDTLAWRRSYKSKIKAFSLDHHIDRSYDDPERRAQLKALVGGRKTPQLRPEFELIAMAQKPRQGTFVENWEEWGTGLVDVSERLDHRSPSTLMPVEKTNKEDAEFHHLTVKPDRLIDHLIRLFSTEGQLVLDPFVGSGTTVAAAVAAGRSALGMDINPQYAMRAHQRAVEASDHRALLTGRRCDVRRHASMTPGR